MFLAAVLVVLLVASLGMWCRYILQRCASAIICTLLALAAPGLFAADWYVDGKTGSDQNAGSKAAPFKNIWRGWKAATAGDTVRILPSTAYGPQYFSGKSGAPGKPITIQGEGRSPHMTRISGRGINFGIMLDTGTNHVRIRNLDVTAPGHGRESGWAAVYVRESHHVDVLGNYAHDAGCAGIQIQHADYSTVKFNRVANNAKDTFNDIFCSGISHHENLDIDDNTGVKMVIANNIVYGNTNVPAAHCASPCTNSDGSGIIIDDTRRTQSDHRAYQGATLVENNLVFHNGGRGVAVYLSDHVTIRANTLHGNNKDPHAGAWRPGEVGITFSGSVSASNNIFYSDGAPGARHTGPHVAISIQDCAGGGPILVDHNLSFNPQNDRNQEVFMRHNRVAVTIGKNNRWADPLFVNPSHDVATANFQVRAGSPALSALATP